jgi:hypothetical protein
VLAAIIQNLQSAQPARPAALPTVKIDRGGGGPSWPSYQIVDIAAAIAAFPEIVGEHPVARAARRQKWIGEALPRIREARERREAGAFLSGVQLGAATQAQVDADAAAATDRLKIEQVVQIIDAVRAETAHAARRRDRGADAPGLIGPAILFGGIGLVVGVALARRARRR